MTENLHKFDFCMEAFIDTLRMVYIVQFLY